MYVLYNILINSNLKFQTIFKNKINKGESGSLVLGNFIKFI